MNFPFYIARRYLFSKKSHNAINIISMVSVCGVVVATMALVCALSVLNGFVGLVSSMLSNFDPELKIQPVQGKVFDPTLPAVRKVKELPEVALFCEVLQDNAQVRYRDRQITATVKGVDDTFGRLTRIDSILVDSREGRFVLSDEVANYANLGVGTAFSLGVRPNYADPLEIYAPKRNEKVNLSNPVASLNLEYAFVGGVYATNQQMYDENFILRARELGLDTLIMGIRNEKAIREALSIPENELLGAVIAVGYRAINPDKPKRKTVDDILKLF